MQESGEYNEVDLSLTSESEEVLLGQPEVSEATLDNPETKLPSTDEILHKVVEAAENNQALEKLLELRHELKDQSMPHDHNQSAASKIGDLLPHQSIVPVSLASKPAEHKSLVKRALTDQGLYGHAIRYGFVSAVLALLLASMLVYSLK